MGSLLRFVALSVLALQSSGVRCDDKGDPSFDLIDTIPCVEYAICGSDEGRLAYTSCYNNTSDKNMKAIFKVFADGGDHYNVTSFSNPQLDYTQAANEFCKEDMATRLTVVTYTTAGLFAESPYRCLDDTYEECINYNKVLRCLRNTATSFNQQGLC